MVHLEKEKRKNGGGRREKAGTGKKETGGVKNTPPAQF